MHCGKAMISIRRITPADAGVLREIRLRALSDTPTAFSSTYARELAFASSEWQTRAQRWASAPDAASFLAFDGNSCCGIVGSFVDAEDESGVVTIVSMWVAPEARRKGLGIRLLETVEGWARQQGFTHLFLDVVENNAQAIALYEKFGFVRTGQTSPYPNDPKLCQVWMRKEL